MPSPSSIDRPAARGSRARRLRVAGWRAGLAALAIACAGPACQAAESMSGLGSAFRPQGWAEAPVAQKRAGPEAGLPGLRVVVSRPSRSVASIDGQLVRVGDTVNNMRVTRIDTDGVTMAGPDGAREWLRVTPAVVKRPRPEKAPANTPASTPAKKTSRVSSGVHQ